jgi:3-deoxy-7-phosphoheptulonate synthase
MNYFAKHPDAMMDRIAGPEFEARDTMENEMIDTLAELVADSRLAVIAGPCSLKDREHALTAAQAAKEAGADVFRGCLFKPRTSPSWSGVGLAGADWCREIQQELGMPVAMEVIEPSQFSDVPAEAVSFTWIGKDSATYAPLLRAAGEDPRPTILKRGRGEPLDRWLGALEHILEAAKAAGIDKEVALCDAGIGGESVGRANADLPTDLAAQADHDQAVFIDPSHILGRRDLVADLTYMAAATRRIAGVMIEADPDPDTAKTDAAQTIDVADLSEIIERARKIRVTSLQ